MINANKLFFTVLVSAALAACGGGDTSAPISTSIATTNTAAAVTAMTAAAVVNQPFTFAAGLPADFGTTSSTDVAFTSTDNSPTFAIRSGGATATGTTTFGSCIFAITASTFPAGSKLAVGQVVRVNPCQLNVATSGGNANGSASNREVIFVLGSVNSNGKNLPTAINADGSVVLNGVTIGTVRISVVTGT